MCLQQGVARSFLNFTRPYQYQFDQMNRLYGRIRGWNQLLSPRPNNYRISFFSIPPATTFSQTNQPSTQTVKKQGKGEVTIRLTGQPGSSAQRSVELSYSQRSASATEVYTFGGLMRIFLFYPFLIWWCHIYVPGGQLFLILARANSTWWLD